MRTPDISAMTSPVRCAYCRDIYDLGTVEVTARYADCSKLRNDYTRIDPSQLMRPDRLMWLGGEEW